MFLKRIAALKKAGYTNGYEGLSRPFFYGGELVKGIRTPFMVMAKADFKAACKYHDDGDWDGSRCKRLSIKTMIRRWKRCNTRNSRYKKTA